MGQMGSLSPIVIVLGFAVVYLSLSNCIVEAIPNSVNLENQIQISDLQPKRVARLGSITTGKDANGCLASHNYTWCAALQKCVQDYEGGDFGPCPVTPTPTPPTCPSNCSGQGTCVSPGQCKCNEGFAGETCDKECPNQCSGHGTCGRNATCTCDAPWTGEACDETQDCGGMPFMCSGAGRCVNHKCVCNTGYTGENCSIHLVGDCPREHMCSDHATHCEAGKCICAVGFTGRTCNRVVGCSHLYFCSGHGTCVNNECQCNKGWRGEACDEQIQCLNGCSGHGTCSGPPGYTCTCASPYSGDTCNRLTLSACPNGCSGKGHCNDTAGKCTCERGFSGLDCSWVDPPSVCRKCLNGQCILGNRFSKSHCKCNNGWGGAQCDQPLPCINSGYCSGHGNCKDGQCECHPGYSGPTCSQLEPACGPSHCSGHGTCRLSYSVHPKTEEVMATARCECKAHYKGANCSEVACPGGEDGHICSGRGVCGMRDGVLQCTCAPGYGGPACGQAVCAGSPPCSGRGQCTEGQCICDAGYAGVDCSQAQKGEASSAPEAAANASTDAGSNAGTGAAATDAGANAAGASGASGAADGSGKSEEECCPSHCSDNGACSMVKCKCICNSDWSGAACDILNE